MMSGKMQLFLGGKKETCVGKMVRSVSKSTVFCESRNLLGDRGHPVGES